MNLLKQLIKARFARTTSLFLAVLLAATIAPQISNIKIASADTGGYSWWDATTLNQSAYDWGYYPCPSSDGNCTDNNSSMFTYSYNGHTYGMADPYLYFLRNCTSYVAWKENNVSGINISGWGNAYQWSSNAPSAWVHAASGYTPQVGDIAQWGSEVGGGFGHVAYVYAVNSGIASLDEYNVAGTGSFTGENANPRTTASNSAGTPDYYIHTGTPPHHIDGFGVFRYNSSNSTYYWYVKDGRYPWGQSYTLNGVPNGSYGDVPVVGDFNGDHTDDFGVFRYNSSNSTYYWYVKDGRYPNGSTYVLNGVPNGSYGDVPVVGDFNGDGTSDFGVFRYDSGTSTYKWYVKDGRYPNGSTYVLNGVPNGSAGDVPVVGDFNGDGTSDFGVFRYDSGTSTYYWYVKDGKYPNGSSYVLNGVPNGSYGDVPVVGYFGGQ